MHEVIFQFISLFAGGDLIIVIVMLLLSWEYQMLESAEIWLFQSAKC